MGVDGGLASRSSQTFSGFGKRSGTANAITRSRTGRVATADYFVTLWRRPNNLSVCDSKQTVAEVWRPCPSRDTARFTQPGRVGTEGPIGTGATFGRDACPARLAGRISSRWCTAIPAIRLLCRMMLYTEPRPSSPNTGPGWLPRRANRVLYFYLHGRNARSRGIRPRMERRPPVDDGVKKP